MGCTVYRGRPTRGVESNVPLPALPVAIPIRTVFTAGAYIMPTGENVQGLRGVSVQSMRGMLPQKQSPLREWTEAWGAP